MSQTSIEKLALVSTTFLLMTLASIKAVPAVFTRSASAVPNTDTLPLECVLFIHYLVYFQKHQAKIQALINFESKVNTITLTYASK